MARKELKIEVDVDAMRLGDLEVLDRAATMERGAITELLDLLGRVAKIEGTDDIRQLPITALKQVSSAVFDAVNAATAEGN